MDLRNIKRLFYVALIQGGNFLFPAATLPFLIRYLGPAEYGLFNLSQTWAIYFSVVIAYGFDFTAAKEVSLGVKPGKQLSNIYSKVFYSKIFLFIVSLLFFCLFILIDDKMKEYFPIYIIMFLWTLNQVFFQSWLFLGLEKQTFVSLFYLISRGGSFLIILLLIYLKLPLLILVLAYSLPQAIAGLVVHWYTVKRYQIQLQTVAFPKILRYLKESFVLFLSTVAGTITISLSVILLGIYSSKESVGFFAVATKVVSLIYGIVLFPFQLVFFPIIVKKVKESYESGIKFFLRIFGFSTFLMALCCILVYVTAPTLIRLFVGEGFNPSVECLRIVCFVPLFALANTLFAFLLVALDRRILYTVILLSGTLMCFILNMLLISSYNEIGASMAWLAAEVCCFIGFVVFFSRMYFLKSSSFAFPRI